MAAASLVIDARMDQLERALSAARDGSQVTPEHVIFIPGVLLVGLALGYVMGAKAARKELEQGARPAEAVGGPPSVTVASAGSGSA